MKRKNIVEKDFMYRGFRCAVVGLSMGHRCGYVLVENPTKDMLNDAYSLDLDVHGGITYGELSKTYPVETENSSFWLGFDCAHCWDGKDFELIRKLNDVEYANRIIEIENMYPTDGEVRDTRYVEGECKRLVDQLLR